MEIRDIEPIINKDSIAFLQWRIQAICLFTLVVDGFDVYVMGIVTPSIAFEFGVPPSSLTLVFFAQQVGLAIGAFSVGPVADRFGRRNSLAAATMGVACFTIAAALSGEVYELVAFRFLGGLCMSGLLPSAITLATEYSPKRRQPGVTSTMLVGYTLGFSLTAAAASVVLTYFDWRMMFGLGGGMAVVAGLLVVTFVPESLYYMARKDPYDPRIARIVTKLDGGPARTLEYIRWTCGTEQTAQMSSPVEVFLKSRTKPTALLWIAQFLTIGLTALFASWGSSLFLNDQGISVANYSRVQAVVSLFAIAGTFCIGPLMQKFGSARVMVPIYVGYALSLAAVGSLPFGLAPSMVALSCQYAFAAAGSTGLIVIAVELYPAAMRAMGLGWCFGIGRLGAIAGPVIGGGLILSDLPLSSVYTIISVVPLLTSVLLTILLLPKHRLEPESSN